MIIVRTIQKDILLVEEVGWYKYSACCFMVMEKNSVQIMHIHHNFGTISKILEEGPSF